MSSWIKLHRAALSHWLYTEKRPLTRREAWENMLLTVNWEPGKALIRGVLYECERGESLNSLETWAKNFNWTMQQLRTFFRLLEKDNMIIVKGLQYTTKVTICNYDTYQGFDDKPNRRTTGGQQTANTPLTTIKESKEDKEKNILPEWKTDFLVYKENCKNGFNEIMNDNAWLIQQASFYKNKNINIKKSVEKCFVNFWATEQGWENKKKAKTETINWKSTIGKSLSYETNHVAKEDRI